MEVWKPACWKPAKFHQNEHTPGGIKYLTKKLASLFINLEICEG